MNAATEREDATEGQSGGEGATAPVRRPAPPTVAGRVRSAWRRFSEFQDRGDEPRVQRALRRQSPVTRPPAVAAASRPRVHAASRKWMYLSEHYGDLSWQVFPKVLG